MSWLGKQWHTIRVPNETSPQLQSISQQPSAWLSSRVAADWNSNWNQGWKKKASMYGWSAVMKSELLILTVQSNKVDH